MVKIILVLSIFFTCSFASYSAMQDVSLVVEVEGDFSGQLKVQAEYNARGMAVQKAFEYLPSIVFGDESLNADGEGGADYSLELRSVMAAVADVDILEQSWVGDYLRIKARVTLDYDRTLRMLTGISTSVNMERQLKRLHDRYVKTLEQVNIPDRPSVSAEQSRAGMSSGEYAGLLPSQVKQEELRRHLKERIENSLDRRYRIELPALRSVQIEVQGVQVGHIDFLITSPGFLGKDAPCVRSPQIIKVYRKYGNGLTIDDKALIGVRLPLRVRLFSDDNNYPESRNARFNYVRGYSDGYDIPSLYPAKLRELFYSSGLGAYRGSKSAPHDLIKNGGDSLAMMWVGSVSLDVYARMPELLLELFVADYLCPSYIGE